MDEWLMTEYVWELPFSLDPMVSLCIYLNLNNALPLVLFSVLAFRRAGVYHALHMPVLRFMIWSISLFVLLFIVLGLGIFSYSCSIIDLSFFRFEGQINSYAPGFVEMFSTEKGFMAFLISSPYLIFYGGAALLGVGFDHIAKNRSLFVKKCASWYWWVSSFLVLPIMLFFLSEWERMFIHRFFLK